MDATDHSGMLNNSMVRLEKRFVLGGGVFLWFYSLLLYIMLSLYIFYTLSPFRFSTIKDYPHTPTNAYFHHPITSIYNNTCNLFDGRWVKDEDGPLYSSLSCKSIPLNRNCLLNGRNDMDYLYWRWKPEGCSLPRFDAKAFLCHVKGKTMAFIGDSLGRNHIESLLCMLSTEEIPRDVYKDEEDKFRTWQFPHHNFTLLFLRSNFLLYGKERIINGSFTGGFHLHLDKLDSNWTQKLPNIDHAIFSVAHWFSRPNYLYKGGKLIGCVNCGEPNLKAFSPSLAIRKAFRVTFEYVNELQKGIVVFLRTFSFAQFEHGGWNRGGFCNRTMGFTRESVSIGGDGWKYRNIQVEEVERAKRYGEKRGNKFEILDVTKMMLMRPDGHPGEFWKNKSRKGYNDCLHWCLPGPIDTWSEILLHIMIGKNVTAITRI